MSSNFIEKNVIDEMIKKLSSLEDDFKSEAEPSNRVNIRIKQLSLSKIIVNIYQKNQFVLIEAYFNLASAYLDMDYFEQAKEHLQTALNLNSSQIENLPNMEIQIKINVKLARFPFKQVFPRNREERQSP